MMHKIIYIYLPMMVLVFWGGFFTPLSAKDNTDQYIKIPDRAEDICPILIGDSLPTIVLRTADNTLFDLNAEIAETPTVLIFYRGGWCPYCNYHLSQLQSIESELIQVGFQIIAISPDKPEILKEHAEQKGIKYQLLSDSEMTASKSLGIAFKVDETTVKRYKKYGMNLEEDSGQKHHLLPVPSVFVIGKDGVIQFSYVNPNHKVRIDSDLLLMLAKSIIIKSNNT